MSKISHKNFLRFFEVIAIYFGVHFLSGHSVVLGPVLFC